MSVIVMISKDRSTIFYIYLMTSTKLAEMILARGRLSCSYFRAKCRRPVSRQGNPAIEVRAGNPEIEVRAIQSISALKPGFGQLNSKTQLKSSEAVPKNELNLKTGESV